MDAPQQPSQSPARKSGRHHLAKNRWRPFRALPGTSPRRHAFPNPYAAAPLRRWWQ